MEPNADPGSGSVLQHMRIQDPDPCYNICRSTSLPKISHSYWCCVASLWWVAVSLYSWAGWWPGDGGCCLAGEQSRGCCRHGPGTWSSPSSTGGNFLRDKVSRTNVQHTKENNAGTVVFILKMLISLFEENERLSVSPGGSGSLAPVTVH